LVFDTGYIVSLSVPVLRFRELRAMGLAWVGCHGADQLDVGDSALAALRANEELKTLIYADGMRNNLFS